MDAHYRKILLQSPSDLTYLLNNIKAAAQQKIDLAIPPSAAPKGEDAYRSKVEELVQEYVTRTLSLALPSLSLNGLDPSPTFLRPDPAPETPNADDDANYEQYDTRLAEKLRTLYAEFDAQSTRVAELRREAPGAAARQYMERLEEELKKEKELEIQTRTVDDGRVVEDLDVGSLERREEIEMMWGRGTEGLVKLGKVTDVRARLERAEKAVEVLDGI